MIRHHLGMSFYSYHDIQTHLVVVHKSHPPSATLSPPVLLMPLYLCRKLLPPRSPLRLLQLNLKAPILNLRESILLRFLDVRPGMFHVSEPLVPIEGAYA